MPLAHSLVMESTTHKAILKEALLRYPLIELKVKLRLALNQLYDSGLTSCFLNN